MRKDFNHETPENWKWGVFYFYKADHRFIVPKRNPLMGWTFKFTHPLGYVFLALILALIIYQTIYS